MKTQITVVSHMRKFVHKNVVAIIERIKDTCAPFYRPELPVLESEDIQPGMETLMKQCWAEEPSERPSFDAILKSLRVINKGKSAFLFVA